MDACALHAPTLQLTSIRDGLAEKCTDRWTEPPVIHISIPWCLAS